MSIPNPVFDSAPEPNSGQNLPEVKLIQDKPQGGRIYTPLPRMWVGMGLAVLCALFQRAGGVSKGGVLLVSIIGTCYWLFCIHRIHKVLAEYTGSKYPISPRKALGFQIIPIFQYYWFFRWTRQLAKFVDAESGEARMPRVWPGLLMSLSSLLGWNPAFKSLRLFLIFALGIYFTRKLRQVLPACEPVALERWHRWNLSMSAGVGAAFGFVLFRAIHDFVHEQGAEQFHELVTILLVSVAMLIFLEPVLGKLRAALGDPENHPAAHAPQSWSLRFVVFGTLALTGLFEGLLHSKIHQAVDVNWSQTLTILLAALLVTGGITYAWIGAAYRKPSYAARSGLLTGVVLGCFLAYTVVAAVADAKATQTDHSKDTPQEQAAHLLLPSMPEQLSDDLAQGHFKQAKNDLGKEGGFEQMQSIFLVPFSWPIFGLLGGIVIDRRWGKRPNQSVALCILVTALLYGLGLWLSTRPSSLADVLVPLWVALGWALALIVCESSKVLVPEETTLLVGHR